jgi:methylmalonyl-CoA/ethylmalonyl-CoA epimerase
MTESLDNPMLPFMQDGIAQVAIVVPDLERAVERYWHLFGIGPWRFYTYGKPLVKRMSYHGQQSEYRMRIALSYLGPLRIELIEPLDGDTVYADFVREHGYGVHHFGLLVADMGEALREAEVAGLEMIQDGSGFGLEGDGHYAYLDTEDEIGVMLELIERPRDRVVPEKVYPPQAQQGSLAAGENEEEA